MIIKLSLTDTTETRFSCQRKRWWKQSKSKLNLGEALMFLHFSLMKETLLVSSRITVGTDVSLNADWWRLCNASCWWLYIYCHQLDVLHKTRVLEVLLEHLNYYRSQISHQYFGPCTPIFSRLRLKIDHFISLQSFLFRKLPSEYYCTTVNSN